MSDLVRARAGAVRTLKDGVSRYGEHHRAAAAAAQSEARAAEAKIDHAVEERKHALERNVRQLHQAEAALAHCQENCGPLQRAVADARAACDRAKHDLDRARRAHDIAHRVTHELAGSLRSATATVDRILPSAAASLAELEAKLAEIDASQASSGGHPNWKQSVLTTAAFILAVNGAGHLIHNVSQGHLLDTGHDQTLSEMHDEQTADMHQQWRDSEQSRIERHDADWGTPQHYGP